jgi:hypothetical protein
VEMADYPTSDSTEDMEWPEEDLVTTTADSIDDAEDDDYA